MNCENIGNIFGGVLDDNGEAFLMLKYSSIREIAFEQLVIIIILCLVELIEFKDIALRFLDI
jgi:hypothetical protein